MALKPCVFLLTVLFLFRGGSAICTPYQSQCTILTAITCCGFPFNLCLPDVNNSTACLFPLDTLNLSPSITSLNPFAPIARNLQNATEMILQLAFNPTLDPLVNPILDPLANPIFDPLVNPFFDPLANPIFDPVVNPMFNPLIRNGK